MTYPDLGDGTALQGQQRLQGNCNLNGGEAPSKFDRKQAFPSAHEIIIPRSLGTQGTIHVQSIGNIPSESAVMSLLNEFPAVLQHEPVLSNIIVNIPGVSGNPVHADYKKDDQRLCDPTTIANQVALGLQERNGGGVWLSVNDPALLRPVTTEVLSRFSGVARPTSVLIGSGQASMLLNAVSYHSGLVTFLGCEPDKGDAQSGTFMSTPASRENLVSRCGPDSREQVFAAAEKTDQIMLPSKAPQTITGRVFGGDIVQFDRFLSFSDPDFSGRLILVIESHRAAENDVSYTLDRWAEHRNSFLRNVDAILVGKVKLGKVGNSDQAFVADKLARALESLGVQGVPIIRTPLFGGKTCPAFLPIGGSVTLSITTEKATLTIPAHVR